MKVKGILFAFVGLVCLVAVPAVAETVAVYPVKTEGFSLNGSDVLAISRIAIQACYDAGLKCSGRGETTAAVQREQQFTGSGKIAGAQYIAECVLLGKTEDRFNTGLKSKSINVFGGAFKKVGGVNVGGSSRVATSGIRFGGSGMNLTCQFSGTADGVLVYSESKEKIGFSGALVLAEGRS
ncbi:MAG: hypothetical protein Q7S00_02670, partial [bacterium]|nr:hypothetical protein [bacterium]